MYRFTKVFKALVSVSMINVQSQWNTLNFTQNNPSLNKSVRYSSFCTYLYISGFGFLMRIQRYYSR